MSKNLQAAKNFESNGINADLIDQLDSLDFERYLGLPQNDNQVLTSLTDGTRQWSTISTVVNWGDIQGTLSNQTDLWAELQNRPITSDIFLKSEFISLSNGSTDAGKPIILNGQGKIDPSMMDVSSFYYVGPWNPENCADPATGCEYPDTTSETPGAFWVAQGLSNTYTFQFGDLAGEEIDNGDFMVWAVTGWSIMVGEMNPTLYYKLDGSQGITNDFNGGDGTHQYKMMADGTDPQDGVNVRQLNAGLDSKADTIHTHEISDTNGLQDALDNKSDINHTHTEYVQKTGDTMTGNLTIESPGGFNQAIVNFGKDGNLMWKIGADLYDNFTIQYMDSNGVWESGVFNINFQSDIVQFNNTPTVSGGDIWHQGNFDPNTKEDYLGSPIADTGYFLTSDMAGNRAWESIDTIIEWGDITGDISNQTDLIQLLQNNYSPINHTHTEYVQKSGDTMTGNLIVAAASGESGIAINHATGSDKSSVKFYDENDIYRGGLIHTVAGDMTLVTKDINGNTTSQLTLLQPGGLYFNGDPVGTVINTTITKTVGTTGDFTTLEDALDWASNQTFGANGNLIIQIEPGTYTLSKNYVFKRSSIEINSSTSNSSDVIIQYTNPTEWVSLFTFEHSNLSLNSVTFTSTNGIDSDYFIQSIASNISIDSCVINSFGYPLYAGDSSNIALNSSTINEALRNSIYASGDEYFYIYNTNFTNVSPGNSVILTNAKATLYCEGNINIEGVSETQKFTTAFNIYQDGELILNNAIVDIINGDTGFSANSGSIREAVPGSISLTNIDTGFKASKRGKILLQSEPTFTNVTTPFLNPVNELYDSEGSYIIVSDLGSTVLSGHYGTTAERPTPTQIGFTYFDTDLQQNIIWNGSDWVIPGNTGEHNNLSGRDANDAHPISSITDLQSTLDNKLEAGDVYLRSEFIDTSTGATDAGKPIVLNIDGKIDSSMLDMSNIYYVGEFDPSDPNNNEYPDTTGETYGASWLVSVLSNPDNPSDPAEDHYYTFTSGDLNGEVININDFMVWGSDGWGIIASQMNPLLYMKLDKSTPFSDNSAPLIVNGKITNVDDGTDLTDAATVGQSVQKSGDTMTGNLRVESDIIAIGDIFAEKDSGSQQGNITAQGSINVGLNQNGNSAIGFGYDGNTLSSALYHDETDNEFKVDLTTAEEGYTLYHTGNLPDFEPNLGNPSSDGQILSSLADGTRSWITPPQGSVVAWGDITGTLSNQTDLQNALDAKENSLGNPTTDNQILSSLTDGTRSWVDIPESAPNFEGIYNPQNGVLIQTGIPSTESAMFRLEIKGNSYNTTGNIFTEIQGYNFGDDQSILQLSGIQLGSEFDVEVFHDINGILCFWIQPWSSAQSFNITFYETDINGEIRPRNITLIDELMPDPGDITNHTTVVPKRYVEDTGTIDADTLDGLDSTDFALSNHNHTEYVQKIGDTMTGPLTLDVNTNAPIIFDRSYMGLLISHNGNMQPGDYWNWGNDGSDTIFTVSKNDVDDYDFNHSGTLKVNGNVVWDTSSAPGANIPINTGDGSAFLADDGTYKVIQTVINWGDIQGDITQQIDLMQEFDKKANYSSQDSSDINTIITQGIYNIENPTNIPSGSESEGTLIVTTNTNNIQQLWQTSAKIYTRKSIDSGSTWDDWVTYASMTFDGNALYINI